MYFTKRLRSIACTVVICVPAVGLCQFNPNANFKYWQEFIDARKQEMAERNLPQNVAYLQSFERIAAIERGDSAEAIGLKVGHALVDSARALIGSNDGGYEIDAVFVASHFIKRKQIENLLKPLTAELMPEIRLRIMALSKADADLRRALPAIALLAKLQVDEPDLNSTLADYALTKPTGTLLGERVRGAAAHALMRIGPSQPDVVRRIGEKIKLITWPAIIQEQTDFTDIYINITGADIVAASVCNHLSVEALDILKDEISGSQPIWVIRAYKALTRMVQFNNARQWVLRQEQFKIIKQALNRAWVLEILNGQSVRIPNKEPLLHIIVRLDANEVVQNPVFLEEKAVQAESPGEYVFIIKAFAESSLFEIDQQSDLTPRRKAKLAALQIRQASSLTTVIKRALLNADGELDLHDDPVFAIYVAQACRKMQIDDPQIEKFLQRFLERSRSPDSPDFISDQVWKTYRYPARTAAFELFKQWTERRPDHQLRPATAYLLSGFRQQTSRKVAVETLSAENINDPTYGVLIQRNLTARLTSDDPEHVIATLKKLNLISLKKPLAPEVEADLEWIYRKRYIGRAKYDERIKQLREFAPVLAERFKVGAPMEPLVLLRRCFMAIQVIL